MNAEGNDGQRQEQERPCRRRDKQSPHAPTSSPSKTEKLLYSGCSLTLDSQQGEPGQYSREDNEYYQDRGVYDADLAAAAAAEGSQETSSDANCTGEATAEEGLLFEDSSYGDEIARWMDDQRRLQQQQQLANGPKGCSDDSSIIGSESEEIKIGPATASENPPKRPASELSPSTPLQKTSSKRRQRSHSISQTAPPDTDSRSSSRRRMDSALEERSQSRLELRAALLALKQAAATVARCRTRYNRAKALVRVVSLEECAALLLEDTSWNAMFKLLKAYKDDAGDCNVKQNFGSEDNKDSPEMVRRLSAWVGKNRKDGKLRGRGVSVSVNGVKHVRGGRALEESDAENVTAGGPTVANVGPCEVEPRPCACALQNGSHSDDSSVFEPVDPDSIHADPYKEIALDSISFDWNPRNSRWLQMYEELRCYKEKHGVYSTDDVLFADPAAT